MAEPDTDGTEIPDPEIAEIAREFARHFAPWDLRLPPADVAAQLHRMDVACAPYPARGSGYFSPLKVYEYLAAGLPVVASAVGQLPAALDGGRLGRLVRPGDAGALAAALAELRADAGRRAELRAAGRRAVLERHTWAQVVQRTLAHAPGRRAA